MKALIVMKVGLVGGDVGKFKDYIRMVFGAVMLDEGNHLLVVVIPLTFRDETIKAAMEFYKIESNYWQLFQEIPQ